jgi:hypothetical protein
VTDEAKEVVTDVVHQEDATQQQQDLDMQNHETEQ